MPTRAMIAEDAFFKGIIENSELNRLAYRQATKEGLKGQAFKDRIVDLLSSPTEQMFGKCCQERTVSNLPERTWRSRKERKCG